MTRPLRLALAATALLLGAYVAWLRACAREESADADDREALESIADRRPPDLDARRAMEAWRRCFERGELVRGAAGDGVVYLTRTGWARIGRPLPWDMDYFLREDWRGLTVERARQLRCIAIERGFIEGKTQLRTVGHSWGLWHRTPAGRAALGEVPRG